MPIKQKYLTILLILILPLSLVAQTSCDTVKYLFLGGLVGIDTTQKIITTHEVDSMIFNICYQLPEKNGQKDCTECYKFNVTKRDQNLRFISSKSIAYEIGKSYRVYKFLYDDPNIADEEEMYFYTPEIGIILYTNLGWGGYGRIIDCNNLAMTQIAFVLTEKIITDEKFYNSWID